jgi:hypothetical protein
MRAVIAGNDMLLAVAIKKFEPDHGVNGAGAPNGNIVRREEP